MESKQEIVDIFHNPFLNLPGDTEKEIERYMASSVVPHQLVIVEAYEFAIISKEKDGTRQIIWSPCKRLSSYYNRLIYLSETDPAWSKLYIWDTGSLEFKCEYDQILLLIDYDGGCSSPNIYISTPFIKEITQYLNNFLEDSGIGIPLLIQWENLYPSSFEEIKEPQREIVTIAFA